jgi:hypothetical protein
MAETLAESPDYRVRNIRVRSVHGFEVISCEEDQARWLKGDCGGRISSAIEERQLRDRATGALDVQHLLLAIGTRPVNSHATSLDHVQSAACIASHEQYAASGKISYDTSVGKTAYDCTIELGENRETAQERGSAARCLVRQIRRHAKWPLIVTIVTFLAWTPCNPLNLCAMKVDAGEDGTAAVATDDLYAASG